MFQTAVPSSRDDAEAKLKQAIFAGKIARDAGRDVGEVRELVSRARRAFETGDYETTARCSQLVLKRLGVDPSTSTTPHSRPDPLPQEIPASLPQKVIEALMLDTGETVNYSFRTTVLDMDIQRTNPAMMNVLVGQTQNVKTWAFPGVAAITDRRILFAEQLRGFWGLKDEYSLRDVIPLETIQGMSVHKTFPGGLRLGVTYIAQGSAHERGFKGDDEHVLSETKRWFEYLVGMRKRELEDARRKERVQYVLDFSFLKAQMEKGGVSLTTLKCPNCSANLDLPSSGQFLKCAYCGNTIRAVDLFERMKAFFGNL